MSSIRNSDLLRKSGFPIPSKSKHSLASDASDPKQSYLGRYLGSGDAESDPLTEPLGPPLGIREVAQIIGCSSWTVRNRYLPDGLPHHRATPNGKLIFYRNQIIRWLLRKQQKGGMAV